MARRALFYDGSDLKRVKVAARSFMGLAHILYLKDYVKGAFLQP